MRNVLIRLLSAAALVCAAMAPAAAGERFITVASTTSPRDSGLFDHMLPIFHAKTGIEVRVVAVGTGHALLLARKGDADVLFVHHKPSEERFVAEGFGVKRFDVMHNDFVIVGPKGDPAAIRGMKDAAAALERIARAKTFFASRGDDSGTHKNELSLWKAANIDIELASGAWYRETGSGMGATLNSASAMNAYTLSDRATWRNFRNKGELAVLVEGDPKLFNQYGVILVNPKKFPRVKADLGQAFIDWILSAEGQSVIAGYKIEGEPAFFPNARRGGS